MRTLWVTVLFVVLGTSFICGQQSSAPATDAQPTRVKVYTVGPDVTAPELLPFKQGQLHTGKCNKVDGGVVLSMLVDTKGSPRNIMFVHPLGSDLDRFALQVAAADRFKPGTHDGVPVVVAQSVEVGMQTCVEEKKDEAGKKNYRLQLRSHLEQKFFPIFQPPEEAVLTVVNSNLEDPRIAAVHDFRAESGVSHPVLLSHVEAVFTDEARRAKYQGTCLLSLIVDEHGMPQNVHVVKKLDYGLSENAVDAVKQYRFKPAMKDGMPVAVMMNVEVAFHLYLH